MSASAAVLARSDFLRAPVLATARPEGFKEWQHFLVQGLDWRLLINFSLLMETLAGRPPRLLPRVIVIAHDQHWTGAVEQFEPTELTVSADLGTMSIGDNRVSVGPDGYRVVIDLPGRGISGELLLTPPAPPSLALVNNQPLGAGRLSWLFVPRLRADGWFRVGDREYQPVGEVAYHDHNWGRFRWGDDFGWEWGSVLPADAADPWSFVFMRKTDRRRLRCLSQALYVWHHDTLAAMFRDAAVEMRSVGLLGRGPDCTLPAPMRLVLGGEASDVPAAIEITAARSGDSVHAVFRPDSYARLAQPSEVHLDRSVVLSEAGGTARITGSINGKGIDVVGAGVFELLHG
jgi:hypothetical protein